MQHRAQEPSRAPHGRQGACPGRRHGPDRRARRDQRRGRRGLTPLTKTVTLVGAMTSQGGAKPRGARRLVRVVALSAARSAFATRRSAGRPARCSAALRACGRVPAVRRHRSDRMRLPTAWSDFDEPSDNRGRGRCRSAPLSARAALRRRIMMPMRRAGWNRSVPVCVLIRGNVFDRRLLCFDRRPRNRREPLTKKVEA